MDRGKEGERGEGRRWGRGKEVERGRGGEGMVNISKRYLHDPEHKPCGSHSLGHLTMAASTPKPVSLTNLLVCFRVSKTS